MHLRVEFYGIPRQRAGCTELIVPAGTLGEVLQAIDQALPEWGAACLEAGRLRREFAANVNGQRFVTELDTRLVEGEVLLVLSADAGG